MAIRSTVSRFSFDPDAQDVSGVLCGITVTPFTAKDENGNPPAYGSDGHLLPRCENCWAFFNNYCEIDQWTWNCSLCGTLNGLSSQAIAKYAVPESCAESASSFIDLELPGGLLNVSGIRVLVKCDKVKTLSVATTSRTGFFQAELPKDNIVPQSSDQPTDCFARVLGFPTQVYASEKDTVSKVVEARHKTSLVYMTSTPLAISMARPSSDKTSGRMNFGTSKTIDLPVPQEWGLPPTSYYTPFIPIIGIP